MMTRTPVVFGLIAVTILVFIGEVGNSDLPLADFALWPLVGNGGPGFHPVQLFSYAFLHGGILHLALNMYALWMFGVPLETRWGSARFAGYWVTCVVGAALVQLLVSAWGVSQGMPAAPVIGASGGVFGLLLAFGLLYPYARLMLLFPPIPIQARWFVLIYGVIELFAGVTGTVNGIAHFAHLGGMLTGYLLLRNRRLFP